MDPPRRLVINMPPSGAQKPFNMPALEQINAEIFTLMYGSIVRQLVLDFEDMEEVNKQLDQM